MSDARIVAAIEEAAKLARLSALLERAADAIELAIDAPTWRECIDILMDLADDLRAETTEP